MSSSNDTQQFDSFLRRSCSVAELPLGTRPKFRLSVFTTSTGPSREREEEERANRGEGGEIERGEGKEEMGEKRAV